MNFRDIFYSLNRWGELGFGVYLMIDSVIEVESSFSITKFAVGTLLVIELIRKMTNPRRVPPPVLNVNGLNEQVGIPPDNENDELDGNIILEPLLRDYDIYALAIFEGGFVFDREAIERLATGSDTHLRSPQKFWGKDLKDCINIETLLREEDLAFIENQFMKNTELKFKTNNTRVVLRQTEVDEIGDASQKTAENNDLKSFDGSDYLDEFLAQAETEIDKKKVFGLIETDVDERYYCQAETNVNEIEAFGQAVIKTTNDKTMEQAKTLTNNNNTLQHAETKIIRNKALENTVRIEDETLEQAEKQITEDEALKPAETRVTKVKALRQTETKITEVETSMEVETEITEDEVLEQAETQILGDDALEKTETHIMADEAFRQTEKKLTEDETQMEAETKFMKHEDLGQAKFQITKDETSIPVKNHNDIAGSVRIYQKYK